MGDFLSGLKSTDDEGHNSNNEGHQKFVNCPDCPRLPLCPRELNSLDCAGGGNDADINFMASAWLCLPNLQRAPVAGWH